MRKLVRILILPSIFILSTTAMAKEKKVATKKNKAHQCAVYKENAKKARNLYSVNKKKANRLNIQLKVLAKDQKRMPASIEMAKTVVKNQMNKIEVNKKKSVNLSLKYLEKHIQYVKAAKRTCAQNRAKPRKRFKRQDIDAYLSIAAY